MWGLPVASASWKAIPTFLLATSSNTPTSHGTPNDLVDNFRKVYESLAQPGAIHRLASPTLTFSYVTPPLNNQSTWNDLEIQQQQLPASLRPDPNKPIAIYLPGLDGYGISAATTQFDDLSTAFQLWRLTVEQTDRSTFAEVIQAVVDCVDDICQTTRNVTLIGESCGGVLAAGAALQLQDRLTGLVLVNPATSFPRTPWADLVPLLTQIPHHQQEDDTTGLTPYAAVGSLLLSAIIPDNQQRLRIAQTLLSTIQLSTDKDPISQQWDLLQMSLQSMETTEDRLPADLLQHRVLKWLEVGTELVNRRLPLQHRAPTLIVVGAQDRLLPSRDEARRWVKELSQTTPVETLIVKDRGHFVLDDTVNLTEAILYSRVIDVVHTPPTNMTATSKAVNDSPLQSAKRSKAYDPITDWRIPADVQSFIETSVKPFRTAFSPVYFSTDENGKRWRGLGQVPVEEGRPLLFVANHQFVGLDLRLLIAELFEQRNLLVRGLAHPVIFTASQQRNFMELGGRIPGLVADDTPDPMSGGFEKYGAVKVTPRNFYRLLQTGQSALLFPGGAAEALSKNTSYPLFWPEKIDFVRTAARFNATIVPLSAVGMVDSFNVLLEPSDLLNVPVVGDRLRKLNGNVTAARYDQQGEDEMIGVPLSLPKVPARNYFVFGRPIPTSSIDPRDKESCARIYHEAQTAVRRGLDDILTVRDADPFKSTPRRLAYERLWGVSAPSIETKDLNART